MRTAHDAVGGDGYDRAGAHDRGSVVCATNICTRRDAGACDTGAPARRRAPRARRHRPRARSGGTT
ncbi:hypothetical protein BURMUCGD1_1058 [Burkholderia multivorans CGD1]|nr:hypothetical protein BURMUCGD1_1058 [Burkholderia multivorans CGD1]